MKQQSVWVLVPLFFFGCADLDEDGPSISFSVLPGAVITNDTLLLNPGVEYSASVLYTDMGAIDQTRMTFSTNQIASGTLNLMEIHDVGASSVSQTYSIPLPTNIAGNWKLTFESGDDFGNLTQEVLQVRIDNAEIPAVEYTYWNVVQTGNSLALNTEDTLAVGLESTDEDGLAQLVFRWREANSGTVLLDSVFTLQSDSYSDTVYLPVPGWLDAGDQLDVWMEDETGIASEHRFTVTP